MNRCLLLASIAALSGCGADEALSPVGAGEKDAGVLDAGVIDAGSPASVKRTVIQRSPLGSPGRNDLVDGDFEFSTVPFTGAQVGWRGFSSDGSAPLPVPTETGGLCRSGLRCAVLEQGHLFFIRGASPAGKGMMASGWAKVPEGSSCNVVRPILITCDTFEVNKVLTAKKPDAGGWCHYTTSLTERDLATCVYVDNTLPKGKTAVLDAFSLGPDDGTVPFEAEFWVPDAETAARLEAMRAYETANLPLGRRARRPPPTP